MCLKELLNTDYLAQRNAKFECLSESWETEVDFIASLSFLRILLSFLNECSLHLCCWKQIKPWSSNAEQALPGLSMNCLKLH